jgi:hypothetical protein
MIRAITGSRVLKNPVLCKLNAWNIRLPIKISEIKEKYTNWHPTNHKAPIGIE